MIRQVPVDRTMDIHLLSQVPDDGSPFGVYATELQSAARSRRRGKIAGRECDTERGNERLPKEGGDEE